jgi:hypothetical protein
VPIEFDIEPDYSWKLDVAKRRLVEKSLARLGRSAFGVSLTPSDGNRLDTPFQPCNPAIDCQVECRRILATLTLDKATLLEKLIAHNPSAAERARLIQRISEINDTLRTCFGDAKLWSKGIGTAVEKNPWYHDGSFDKSFKKSVRTVDKAKAMREVDARADQKGMSIEQTLEHTRLLEEIEEHHTLQHQAPLVGAVFESGGRRWQVTGFLGSGSFGDAWQANEAIPLPGSREFASEVCIKTFRNRSSRSVAEAKADFVLCQDLLRKLCTPPHPNMCNILHVTPPGRPGRVKIVDRYSDGTEEERVHGWCHFIVMDLCKCELFQYTKDMWGGEKGCKSGKFQEHFARPLFRSVCTPHTSLCPSFENQVVSPLPQGVASERRVLARPWLLPQRHQER